MAQHKKKFFRVLKDIFIGQKINGKGGYVNLMKIKSKYYGRFEKALENDIATICYQVGGDFREEMYLKLYTFFKKYFSESGSIFFAQTAAHEKVYEKIYRDDKDVMLFWKTNQLYYVKTERLYKDLEIEVGDFQFKFFFDVEKLEHKKSNEKKDLMFEYQGIITDNHGNKAIHLNVLYSQRGRKTKVEAIYKAVRKETGFKYFSLETLENALNTFKRQSEVDYFIHKNAKAFLEAQFDFWIKDYLMNDDTVFNAERLAQLKALKTIAYKIISLVAQFEDELVKIWNKPKFVRNSNYVITLDRIAAKNLDLIKAILNHENTSKQVEEWQSLGMIDQSFAIDNILQKTQLNLDNTPLNAKYQYLPIDTKYFKDLELQILGLFDNLDEALDGRLIHSENYQALNTIQQKFRKKVQAIYIDPPFNTGSDFDYLDNYQSTTWLSIINDRLLLTKDFLLKSGTYFLHLDYRANYYGRILLENIYSKGELINEIIWCYSRPSIKNQKNYTRLHDTIYWFSKERDKHSFNGDNVRIAYSEKTRERNKYGAGGSKYAGGSNERNTHELGKLPEDYWYIPLPPGNDRQFLGFETQKPEHLLDRIIIGTSDKRDIILDYFIGSGTTIAAAQKNNRKWIGIEMGKHIYTVVIPRLKKLLSGYQCGISKKTGFKGGGFFKYYTLEQYEETLNKTVYTNSLPVKSQDIYTQYLFLKDKKLSAAVEIDDKAEAITVDLSKLYPDIDIAETLSNLLGKYIKRIEKDKVIFADGMEVDTKNLDYRLIKPLIWW